MMEHQRSVNWLEVAKFIKDYFAIISVGAIVVGIIFATIFLYAYLSIFDWRLFWFVQYQDILTFALIALGAFGGFSTFLISAADIFFSSKLTPRSIAVLFIISLAMLGVYLLLEHATRNPNYSHVIIGYLTVVMVVSLELLILETFMSGRKPTSRWIAFIAIAAIAATAVVGVSLALSVSLSRDRDSDVYLVSGKSIDKATVVLMMSHHTILYKDGTTYVVPTTDISQVVTTGRQ
jgi:hypothetical protein